MSNYIWTTSPILRQTCGLQRPDVTLSGRYFRAYLHLQGGFMTKLTTIAVDQLQSMQGTKLGISPWVQLSQLMVNQFADITNDHQFIHTDPERASAETPFGGTIAHGFLTLSQLTQMAESTLPVIKDVRMSINYGFDRIRFITPVRSDARVRAHFTLELAEERTAGEWTLHHDISVEIEHNKRPALSAIWITRQYTG